MQKYTIIGCGTSAIALALNAIRMHPQTRITLIGLDRGPAYSTDHSFHLLNVPAGNMGIFHDKPNDFAEWLQREANATSYIDHTKPLAQQFLPRFLFRQYLEATLKQIKNANRNEVYECFEEVIDIAPAKNNLTLITNTGHQIEADKVILAYGNLPPKNLFPHIATPLNIANPWNHKAVASISRDATVLIIGNGLTMADTFLSLQNNGHKGFIYSISRRGLLSCSHQTASDLPYVLNNIGLPKSIRQLVRFVRAEVSTFTTQGGDWQNVINGLRPITQKLWMNLSIAEQRMFLRHVQPYWDIHRHRLPPTVADQITDAQAAGRLQVMAGNLLEAQEYTGKIRIKFKQRSMQMRELIVDHVIHCNGPDGNFLQNNTSALLLNLAKRGMIKADSHNMGLAIAKNGAIIDQRGEISDKLFTLGSPCKGTLLECTAIPEIRMQAYNMVQMFKLQNEIALMEH